MIFWSWWLIKHAVNLTMMNGWNVHHVYWWRGYLWVASKKIFFFRVKISLIKSIKLVWDKFYSKTTINSYFSNMKGLYWKSKMVCKKGEEGKEIDISFAMFWENLRADGHFSSLIFTFWRSCMDVNHILKTVNGTNTFISLVSKKECYVCNYYHCNECESNLHSNNLLLLRRTRQSCWDFWRRKLAIRVLEFSSD